MEEKISHGKSKFKLFVTHSMEFKRMFFTRYDQCQIWSHIDEMWNMVKANTELLWKDTFTTQGTQGFSGGSVSPGAHNSEDDLTMGTKGTYKPCEECMP